MSKPHESVVPEKPRNERALSSRMMAAIWIVPRTRIGVAAFGRTWRRMIRVSRAPMARAALTYSSSRIESASPRATRANQTQLTSPTTRMTVPGRTNVSGMPSTRPSETHGSGIRTAARPHSPMSAIASTSDGNASEMSANRISASSTRPRL